MRNLLHRPAWLSRLRHWRETEGGQTLVEFAMVLPIFLVMIFALVDFGRAYYDWLLVTNAAREGARAAAVQSDSTTIDNKLYTSFCPNWPSTSGCGLDTSKVTVTKTNVQGTKGTEVKVQVSYDFNYVTPIGSMISFLGGGSLSKPTISATSSMRLE